MDIPKPKKLAEDIADYLGERIIRQEIGAGERIVEAVVAGQFNVSHGPVREAFQMLEKYHLVELIPRKGARVKEFSVNDVRCLFEVMVELVRLIVRLCCSNRTDEEREKLLELEKEAERSAVDQDLEGYFDTTYAYALLALETTRNRVLKQMVLEWLPNMRRAYYLSISQSQNSLMDSATFLKSIMTCIAKQDARVAEATVMSHIEQEQARILKIVRDINHRQKINAA
ncbi:MAG: GntR family transcriptional regulator [Thermodesulfobacteriota bacterium]